MDVKIKNLQAERTQLYSDFYQNIIPKRIPVEMSIAHSVLATKGGVKFAEAQWDFTKLAQIADEVCQKLYSDRCPIPSGNGTTRIASYYSLLGAKAFKMVDNGFIQHPEVSSMPVEDYEEFSADPYKYIIDKAIPSIYDNLNPALQPSVRDIQDMADKAREQNRAELQQLIRGLTDKYGFTNGCGPKGSMGTTETPLDMLADLLRSFSGMSTDIRRNRQKVLDACEALYPLCFKLGIPSEIHYSSVVNAPIHMPPFMRPKDMEELYMPTAKRMAEEYAALGVRFGMFWEGNCMQHIDLMQEFPANLQYRFEHGDPKLVKDKLGDKYIVGGFYPLELVDHGTKEEVIDELKKLLDIMMPNGGFLFSFDKGLHGARDVNLENMNLIAEYLRDNAVYGSEAGNTWGKKLNCEGFTCDLVKSTDIKSAYSFDWEAFRNLNPATPEFARKRLEKLFDERFAYNMSLMF